MNLSCILKNRTVIGLLCVVLSLLICFGLTPLFNNALKAQTAIIRVTKDIKKGEVFSNNNTEKVKVGAYNLPASVIKNESDLSGKFATADLMKGDYILSAKVTDQPYEENDYLYNLDGKRHAISISIKDFALGLSGKLMAGDIVSIIASDYGEMRQTVIPPELQYVEVVAVTTAKGLDEGADLKSDSTTDDSQLPATITVLANDTQAKILADLEEQSKIHVALVYRGDKSISQKFLDAQDDVFNTPGQDAQKSSMQGGTENAQ